MVGPAERTEDGRKLGTIVEGQLLGERESLGAIVGEALEGR